MKHKTKSLLITLLTALMIMTMLPTTAFAASKKVPSKVSVAKVTASTNSVTVSWKKASNATSYRIYYKQSGAKKWITVANVTGTSYTHKTSKKLPLVGGKKYVYTVRAYNKSSKKWGSYDTKGKTVTIPAVPATVKMGAVKGTAYNKVSISWSKASNATSYRVYYKKSGAKNWSTVADVTGTSYTHTSSKKAPLTAGGKYVYTVRAYNKTSKKWGGYNTKGIAVTVPKKATSTPTPAPASGPITKITFPKVVEITANVGDTYQLEQPILTPANPTNKALEWTPDTPDDVLVDKNGKITILNVDVDASVTAHSADNYRICGTCEIRIRSAVPVTSVSLSQTSINMEVGQRVDLTASIAPANASNKRLGWGVYDDSIASVYQSKMSSTSDWYIVAWRPGTVTMRLYSLYDETIYATCTVTVTETCEHEFDDGIIRYEPTCTEEGAKTVTCIKCGYMKRIDLPALGHTWEHHDATGHEEQVLIKEAYDEDVYDEEGIKTGTIHHDAEYETKWVEDTPAYDVCTVCGATKE